MLRYKGSSGLNKERLNLSNLNSDEDFNFLNEFLSSLNEVKNLYLVDNTEFKKKIKALVKSIENIKIPFDQQVIQQFDFLLDKYVRSHQDPFYSEYSLKLLYYFVRSDARYCEALIHFNFFEKSKKSFQHAFPCLFLHEILIFNCIISNEETRMYLKNYPIDDLISNLRKISDYQCYTEIFKFFSYFIQLEKTSENSILKILELFTQINENDYTYIDKIRWSQILLDLINSDYFNLELFFNGALFRFYQNNFNNPFHIPFLSKFYIRFIYKYPQYKNRLIFDFLLYIKLLFKENFMQLKNERDYIQLIDEKYYFLSYSVEDQNQLFDDLYNDIKISIYITLGLYLDTMKEGMRTDENALDFDQIRKILDDFQKVIIEQVFNDQMKGIYQVKENSLFFLSMFAIIKPDTLLKNLNIIQYINFFSDFIDKSFNIKYLEYFLYSITILDKYIQLNPMYQEICKEINKTDTFNNLREFANDQESLSICTETTFFLLKSVFDIISSQCNEST